MKLPYKISTLVMSVLGAALLVMIIIFIIGDSSGVPNFANSVASTNTNSSTNTTFVPNYPFTVLSADKIQGKHVTIETKKGNIVFELYADAPVAASNFIYLAGKGFYDGLKFHRVEAGFVIQGGDPKGDGTGGPGYTIADETPTRNYDEGIVAMAKTTDANSAGSQFFIMLADNATLPKQYAIFGKVTAGMDVVKKIAVGDVMTKVTVK